MAGLGKRTFAAGEVLTAANVNGYLMDQSVMVFADSTARDTALGTAVSQGMVSYLQDTSTLQVYGTAWADVAPAVVEPTFTASTATTYTVATSDAGNYLSFTNAATVTISTATAFTAGQQVQIFADGTALSIASSGVTLAGAGTAGTAVTFSVGNQYEAVSVFCVGSNAYRVIGNVTGA